MLSNIRASYIFNTLAIMIIVIAFMIYVLYQNAKNDIIDISYNDNRAYIENISQNISKNISETLKKDFYNTLDNDNKLKNKIDSILNLFVTKKYKYIYLVDKPAKNTNHFRFLADGSVEEEKSEFSEIFQPMQTSQWDSVIESKKPIFFKHSKLNNLWTTYLHPILINNEIEAILVIDFSLVEQNKIKQTLVEMENMFKIGNIFIIVLFLLILWFSYIDKKREKEKIKAFEMLTEESKKVQDLNKNLESRVKDEVAKNIIKDKQLLQQSRLAQMGEMISMIAHQWRQPLSVISSIAISLNVKAELGKANDETVIDFSKKISEYSQHLSSTIDDFRDFYKPNKKKEYTDFNSLIDSVLRMVEIEITTNNIEIIKDLKSKKRFQSYPNELKQVILNLLKNAQDILTEKDIPFPWIKIKSYINDGKIILEISDNGGGVPEEVINNIFDPYFSTKLDKNGTGIGLYMSRLIIHEHCNGKLSVANTKDGAVFKIEI